MAAEFPAPLGELPEVCWQPCETLQIDHAYQRMTEEPASKRLIQQIAENWDWRLCSPLTVSHRANGGEIGFYVIDGQHRLRAAELRGDIEELPCIISVFDSLEDEARLFVAVNTARRQVGEIERFHARVASKDPWAIDTKKAAEGAGMKIARYSDPQFWQPLEIGFPARLEAAVRQDGISASIILNLLAGAYPTKALLRGKDLFDGLYYLQRCDALPQTSMAKAIKIIGARLQRAWTNERNRLRGERDDLIASVAMAVVFAEALGVTLPLGIAIHQRRFGTIEPRGNGLELDDEHPALAEKRTVFPSKVIDAGAAGRVLKSGEHNRKIGKIIEKGRWKGFPIFTLTLEERATCPPECQMLRFCYGNNMHFSERLKPGAELEEALTGELGDLQDLYPEGFVIRLHVLGDFYSLEYVQFWQECLSTFPALNIYGYTAHDPDGGIGEELLGMAVDQWERFAMRFSGSDMGELAALVIDPPVSQCPDNAFICPAQKMKISCCAACALCWESEKNVAFLRH